MTGVESSYSANQAGVDWRADQRYTPFQCASEPADGRWDTKRTLCEHCAGGRCKGVRNVSEARNCPERRKQVCIRISMPKGPPLLRDNVNSVYEPTRWMRRCAMLLVMVEKQPLSCASWFQSAWHRGNSKREADQEPRVSSALIWMRRDG